MLRRWLERERRPLPSDKGGIHDGSAICLVGVLLLTACGGDTTGPYNANVGGTWLASFSNFSGSGITCNATGISIQVSQSGSTFSGTYTGGTFTCVGPGGSVIVAGGSGTIINGVVTRNSVSFDADTPDSHFTGSVAAGGTSMSGSGTDWIDIGGGQTVVLSGSWGAAKQ